MRSSRTGRPGAMAIVALAALGAIGAGLYVGAKRYLEYSRASETARLIAVAEAQADKLDHGWRFEDIEKAREQIPDDRNSALVVQATIRMIPKGWFLAGRILGPDGQEVYLDDRLWVGSPADRPVASLRKELKDLLGKAGPALTEALKLADMPKGRYAVEWKLNQLDILLPHNNLHVVTRLLSLEAARRAYDGDMPGALVACRAVLNAGRSVGDEPQVITQLKRRGAGVVAVLSAERALGQGRAAENDLAVLQRSFEEEAAEPLLLIGMRGERALWHRFMLAILEGRTSLNGLEQTPAERRDELNEIRPSAPQLLELANLAVEAAKAKPDDWKAGFAKVDRRSEGMKPLPVLTAASWARLVESQQRRVALLRCAAVALAVERYHVARGAWPESLDKMVEAGLLKAVPRDPFDGRPLRIVKRGGGVVVYSVGVDEADDGGKLDRQKMTGPGVDVGFELFAPDSRGRQ
jgi:hypothetical protein